MKSSPKMKKHSKIDLFDKYSCALCGDEDIYSGIVFKGHFVCEDCVEYVSSGTTIEEGRVTFCEKEPQEKKSEAASEHDTSDEPSEK